VAISKVLFFILFDIFCALTDPTLKRIIIVRLRNLYISEFLFQNNSGYAFVQKP